MNNKFKINQKVLVNGYGKNENELYVNKKGKVIEKDDFFLDYNIAFSKIKSDWFNENCLKAIRNYKKGNKNL
ncbi:MAG: hypothetical protein Q4G09_00930 [Clostridia bacterium]|nr:hypothetical protein [Clostridia bacterium]